MDRRSAPAAGKRLTAAIGSLWLLLMAAPPAGAGESWRQDRRCGKPHAFMVPIERQGCYRAWCSATELGELCACVRENPEETHFVLERIDAARKEWRAPIVPPMGGDARHFRVDRTGEGRLLVAVLASESVGIAISDWIVWAIDRKRVSQPLQVQNYGTLSFATNAIGSGACDLLAARWQSGFEPRRGHGTYIAGSWYTIERGEFVPVTSRPPVYRRYLLGVEQARFAAENEDRPFLWFRDASVKAPKDAKALFERQPGR